MVRATLFAIALFSCLTLPAVAQTYASAGEQRTEHAFDTARRGGAPTLYAFLKPFPKGADLHMHFSGAVYAETFIADAVTDNLCVDTAKLSLIPNKGLTRSIPPQPVCDDGAVPATAAVKDQSLYDHLVNSFSLRSFVPFAGYSGHDQFFDTFGKFGYIDKAHQGEWLDELVTRAAAQNEQYLEIMHTPSFSHALAAMAKAPWPANFNDANHLSLLASYRDALFQAGLRDDVPVDAKEIGDILASRKRIELCRNPGEQGDAGSSPGCAVDVHFLYQVLRGFPPAQVFAQALLGFELASAHPDQVVGINFVRAEDRRDAMAEYHTEMLMLDYLHSVYPKVHISLHAGELAPGLVPPAGLTFHIREAIELGHAERIGHGVDVLYEDRPRELLKEMAARHIDVEINLVSNEGILGVTGSWHPLRTYIAAHVPFSLSTDDEGVSRTDLTENYVQAVTDQGLTYAQLKQSARSSLEHSFLPGASLWAAADDFYRRTSACAAAIGATSLPTGPCRALLDNSEKAAQQWELERRFAAFEAAQTPRLVN